MYLPRCSQRFAPNDNSASKSEAVQHQLTKLGTTNKYPIQYPRSSRSYPKTRLQPQWKPFCGSMKMALGPAEAE